MKNTNRNIQKTYRLAKLVVADFPTLSRPALAFKLAERAHCSRITARRWIERVLKDQPPQARGGPRPGSGWTREQRELRREEAEINEIREWLQE